MVKSLNTLTATLMVDPKTLGESSTIFVSGYDAAAKEVVVGLLQSFGHDVVIGTRDPAATLARTEPDGMGNPPYAAWAGDHADVALDTFAAAAATAELVVNASSGVAALDVLAGAGAENRAGKGLLDIANPLDFSAGFPPTLSV